MIIFYRFKFVNAPKNCRLTLQVTDVLRLRRRACEARPATAKCGGRKLHKGRSPTAIFWNPTD